MYSTATPPVVVVVGNYGVGKSSFVKALIGDINATTINSKMHSNNKKDNDSNTTSSTSRDSSSRNSEFQLDESELIVEPHIISIDNFSIRIVDTAARDVMGTQQLMLTADLVIVLMNASSSKSIDDLDEYWLDQFNDISLYSPVIACFNQIDRLNDIELDRLRSKFDRVTLEHFVLERIIYVSAYSNLGIAECKQCIISIINNVRLQPRWILIDPYTWKLQQLFECALHRIFRLLDRDCDNVLNLVELKYFNTCILHEEFTANAYNFLLRRLNEQNDQFVTPQGLTENGFRHLMKRFAIAKKWDRCWDVLHFYHYQNNLCLHNRVFPSLPIKENDQTFELTKYVYNLLEKLFNLFADDTIIDNDNKSIASSMISSAIYQQQQFKQEQIYDNDDDDDNNDIDEGKVLSMDGIKQILSVLPSTKPELHCTLLDRHVIDHFETAGRKLNKLTKNGWLSFWAMFAVENENYCFKQLTYLDLATDTDRSSWYKLTERKIYDIERERISRSVIRVLLFGGPQCGKTVFCDRLLCRIPIPLKIGNNENNKYNHKSTQHFRAVSNRIGASNEYNFLAITEVPAINQYIEQAMDNFLNAYDMILLMFDVSQSRSFYELNKIYDRMPKTHSLPIQILATKADLKHVQQYNLDKDDDDDNDKYGDINNTLNNMGLYQYAQTWLNSNDSCDFPQLFDDIFFIATNPHFRRLKKDKLINQQNNNNNNLNQNNKNNNNYNKRNIDWKTIIKRTITITCGVSIVLYATYKIYKWYYYPLSSSTSTSSSSSSSSSNTNQDTNNIITTRRYRR